MKPWSCYVLQTGVVSLSSGKLRKHHTRGTKLTSLALHSAPTPPSSSSGVPSSTCTPPQPSHEKHFTGCSPGSRQTGKMRGGVFCDSTADASNETLQAQPHAHQKYDCTKVWKEKRRTHHGCSKAHIACHDVCRRRCSRTILPWYSSATEPSLAANNAPRPCANLTSCRRTLAARSMACGLGAWRPKHKGGCQQHEARKRKWRRRENAATKRGKLEPERVHMWHSVRPGAGGKAKRAGLVQTGKSRP